MGKAYREKASHTIEKEGQKEHTRPCVCQMRRTTKRRPMQRLFIYYYYYWIYTMKKSQHEWERHKGTKIPIQLKMKGKNNVHGLAYARCVEQQNNARCNTYLFIITIFKWENKTPKTQGCAVLCGRNEDANIPKYVITFQKCRPQFLSSLGFETTETKIKRKLVPAYAKCRSCSFFQNVTLSFTCGMFACAFLCLMVKLMYHSWLSNASTCKNTEPLRICWMSVLCIIFTCSLYPCRRLSTASRNVGLK